MPAEEAVFEEMAAASLAEQAIIEQQDTAASTTSWPRTTAVHCAGTTIIRVPVWESLAHFL
jgi:hypothetical protein